MATANERAPAADNAEFDEGNRLARAGDLDAAEEAYRRADEQGHGTAAAYVGLFAEARGGLDEAREAFRRADERGDGYGAFRLGLNHSRAGDWDGAAEAWKRAEERGYEEPPFDPVAMRAPQPSRPAVAPSEIQRSAFAN